MASKVHDTPEAATKRLKVLRFMKTGENQTRFATQMEIGVTTWNNFERGRPLSKEVALTLVQKIHGLTTDWLFLGRADGLPGVLRKELEDASRAFDAFERSAPERGRGASAR